MKREDVDKDMAGRVLHDSRRGAAELQDRFPEAANAIRMLGVSVSALSSRLPGWSADVERVLSKGHVKRAAAKKGKKVQ